MVTDNEAWYGTVYATYFENNPDLEFVDLQLMLNETQHNAGIPEPKYNIYMVRARNTQQTMTIADSYHSLFHFALLLQGYSDGIVRFTGTSKNIPGPFDLYKIYINGITMEYLTDVVRAIKGTPFQDVLEAFTARDAQP